MNNQFTEHVNLKQMLIDNKSKHVLEVGALNGDNTRNLIELQKELGYKLTVISDDLPEDISTENVTYVKGVSYLAFDKLDDQSIDIAIIDTDHNYWTLQRELVALHKKLTFGALVVIHDVEEFYYNTGIADGYGTDTEYPKEQIKEVGLKAGSLGTGLIDFLSLYKFNYKLIRWLPEECGCAVIKKNPEEFEILIAEAVKGKGKRASNV